MSNYQRIMDVFASASELPKDQRDAFLESACNNDAAILAEVQSLLKAHDAAGRFLSQATVDVKSSADPTIDGDKRDQAIRIVSDSQERYGEMIGRYKLLEVIGEGGFGTVWMAEQKEPVKRRVALKIIKLGMDTRQVIARFEAERQALAMMDHPSIAKVFDAGATDSGRPYFVMEYIKGVPIMEYCDTQKLNTTSRLELFAHICHAIQHAHQKGIIHRDIKPGNVLVTMHDGVPVPKVIDFGIAKATNTELTQRTLFTEHRQLIGTPAYMSPEQAEMSGLDIDTRSDIYSLGVLLYQLLTGTTPFATEQLVSEGFAEMMRIIREVDPPKPSTRLSTLGQAATKTAQQRNVGDSRKLASILQGDLDWIVMKCLEKDRTRRYESASSLATDIKRFLHDEPVTAGAPSTAYRLHKFVKRNLAMVIAAGAVAAALVLGITGTTIGLLHALNQSERANQAAQQATLAAEAQAQAKLEAQHNELRAIEQAQKAQHAREQEAKARARAENITNFVTNALRSSDAQNSGTLAGSGEDMTVLAAMDNAISDINAGRFKEDPQTQAQLLDTISEILRNNGKVNAAEPLAARALELFRSLHKGDHSELASGIEHLAIIKEQLGSLDEAESLMREALAMRRRLHSGSDSAMAGTIQSLGMLLLQKDRLQESEDLCIEALDFSRGFHQGDHVEVAICLNNLALVKKTQGNLVEAEKLFVQALDMHRRIYVGDHPEVAAGLNNLAMIRGSLNQLQEAKSLFLEATQMRERLYKGDHPATANTLANLAAVLVQLHQLDQAQQAATRALEMRQRLFRTDHPSISFSLAVLASIRQQQGQLPQARALFVEALEMNRRIYKSDSLETALILNNLAVLLREQGLAKEALPMMAQALGMRERIFNGNHPLIVATLRNLAKIHNDLAQYSESDEFNRRADDMEAALAASNHNPKRDARADQAFAHWSRRELDKSIPLYESLLKDLEKNLGPEHPQTIVTAANLGVNYKDAGRITEALPLLEQAQLRSRQYPQLSFVAPHLIEAYAKSPQSSLPQNSAKAIALVDETVAAFRAEFPANGPQLTGMLAPIITWLDMLKAWDKAEPLAREVLSVRTQIQPDVWSTFSSMSTLGGILLAQGKIEQAQPLLLDGYEGMKQRESTIPPQATQRLVDALDRLIALAAIKGDAAELAKWRAERARRTTTPDIK